MNDNKYLVETICEKLGTGVSLVLASIISIQGSSPRHGGTKMVVDNQGKCYGTIGGSLLEATVIKEAASVLSEEQSRLMHFDLAGEDAYAKDMICGGKVLILLDFIAATAENFAFFKGFRDTIRTGSDAYFYTMFHGPDEAIDVLGHTLYVAGGETIGTFAWQDADLETVIAESRGLSATDILPLADIQVVLDPIRKLETLYCFGAGHVALPTAHMAALAGFRVVVIDDRAEFANAERFPDADEVCIIADFSRALDGLAIDADSYIVIVTRGHAFDRVVLEAALKTDAGYIGMISSRRKRDAIYAALTAEGISIEALARIHSPIGLPIGGETPEEIAVSIVAELISERYKKKT
jgi:xanthine dehydrogenase accessory factor